MTYELYTSLTETEVKVLWDALYEAHQTAINSLPKLFGNEHALRMQQRKELYNAISILERKCSHTPYIQQVAVTLKYTLATSPPDHPPAS